MVYLGGEGVRSRGKYIFWTTFDSFASTAAFQFQVGF